MKAPVVVGLIAYLVAGPALAANCFEPHDPPHVPDGATASREDMVTAMAAIKAYGVAVKQYHDCVLPGRDMMEQLIAERAQSNLAAIADKFNAEMFAFKKKNGS
jgi:hypothetical protein